MKNPIYLLIALVALACSPSKSQNQKEEKSATPAFDPDFNAYWYAGEAEISSYNLRQSRYGEIHEGTAVLVFVTEPFSSSKQVKLDNWEDKSEDNVSVLKLNLTKKFITGIYPYSMMMSTFTPVAADEYPSPFKVTTSSQEWCGHTFMQINEQKNSFKVRGFSYFESEGDIDQTFEKVLLEDELWSRIRLNSNDLPEGAMDILPSTFYLRLKHKSVQPQKATLSLISVESSRFEEEPHQKYTIEYEDRSIIIYFEEGFPNEILGWEEIYDGLTTTASRIKTIKSPYWQKNHKADSVLRKELGLK